jgi:uncharacterized protein (DUF488 family)
LVDVRTVPRSRYNPQFNTDSLAVALEAEGIRYEHAPGLGGFRKPRPDTPNAGWRNLSFRGYADYMQTPEFATHLQAVIDAARSGRPALMCAEAVPWRCHRSLISDALLVRGIRVAEITGESSRRDHVLASFARVEGTTITYPPEALSLPL